MGSEMLKPRQVAERLGVDVTTVNTWIREQGLPAYGPSPKRRWLDWDDVVAWLKARPQPGRGAEDATIADMVALATRPLHTGRVVIDLPRRR